MREGAGVRRQWYGVGGGCAAACVGAKPAPGQLAGAWSCTDPAAGSVGWGRLRLGRATLAALAASPGVRHR